MSRRRVLLSILLTSFAVNGLDAADKSETYTDPGAAGADFKTQGEYTGEVTTNDGKAALGIQVIALGDGKFRGVAYVGGLPGDGWDGSERRQADGERVGDVVRFSGDEHSAEIKVGQLTIFDAGGTALGVLEKVRRKSPTLGKAPPEGAVVLFDGTTPDHFKGGRMTEDGLLMQGVTSKQKFGGFKLHLEFRTPFMPSARGQGRGNSGCYAQGRYEVQILDSFGLEGKHNEAGGIYSIRDPNVNMCLPPLAWQTYDVDFSAAKYDVEGNKTANARMTVRHNGVVVHRNVEIPKATTGAPVKEGPEPGPIYLQDHGNPVRFRNIWLVEKSK